MTKTQSNVTQISNSSGLVKAVQEAVLEMIRIDNTMKGYRQRKKAIKAELKEKGILNEELKRAMQDALKSDDELSAMRSGYQMCFDGLFDIKEKILDAMDGVEADE